MNKNKLNTSSEVIVTAGLSAGLTIILSLTNIVLSILALIFRYDCNAGDLVRSDGADYFIVTILRVYIQDDSCDPLHLENLTKSHSVFILTIIILVFAVINLITSITLISAVKQEDAVQNLDIIVYIHVGACLAALVIDLTLGVHFGMDYQTVNDLLSLNSPGLAMNYQLDMIRLGAFLLMTVSLKGFVGYTINIILLVLLILYLVEYQRKVHENEHPIHKLGVLNAFDNPKRFEDPWHAQRNDVFMAHPRGTLADERTLQRLPNAANPKRILRISLYSSTTSQQVSLRCLLTQEKLFLSSSLHQPNEEDPQHLPMRGNHLPHENTNNPKRIEDPWNMHRNDNMFMGYPRGPQVNPAFNHDEEPPRALVKENPLSDYNRNNKRPETWLHNQIGSGPGLGSRPFSYLEEPKRPLPIAVKPPTTPTNDPQWRRDAWPPAPPVPDPDYSPPPRRLKSALKSNYP